MTTLATAHADAQNCGSTIEKTGTDLAYLTRNGEPLPSVGGLSDFTFFGDAAYDWMQRECWAAERGMNHLRGCQRCGPRRRHRPLPTRRALP